jgi:predicted PurR-regulated permease PerM
MVDWLETHRPAGDKKQIENYCGTLINLTEEERIKIIRALLSLGMSNGDYSELQRKLIHRIAALLQIPNEKLTLIEEDAIEQYESRRRILKSGTGLLVALIVIVIFILTATFLKSVIFGLILAYIFLPLEKFYERQFSTKPFFVKLFALGSSIACPFKKLSTLIHHEKIQIELQPSEMVLQQRRALIGQATMATVTTFIMLIITLGILFAFLTAPYVSDISKSVRDFVGSVKNENIELKIDNNNGSGSNEQRAEANRQLPPVVKHYINKLEALKPKLENLPLVKAAVNEATKYLSDTGNQKALMSLILEKTSGFFSFTTDFVRQIFIVLLNILLTMFFFILILKKMAEFCPAGEFGGNKKSEYLVNVIYKSKWLPGASEETLTRAREIIYNIIIKLKIWLRGYLTIILIESPLYIIMFFIIGVPYALPLGFLAGCTVLLPLIGPIGSAILTLVVCLAVGGTSTSMLMLVAVIATYVIITGVLDQLFIYPSVIGQALGLTTLETIIVVLLGGFFVGLTGMVFAVPTAAVLKYLIPQVYNCWK